jgi:hypothetical protein
MTTITIDLDDDLARQVEESARREHKSVSEWVRERMKADFASRLSALEAVALKNGYPSDWTKLYASLADDESFVAPARGGTRPVISVSLD